MIVDCHVHLNPPAWNAPSRPQAFFDIPAYLEKQQEAGISGSVFNNNFIGRPGYFDMYDLQHIREYHDWAAEITATHGTRLQSLASANPFEGGEHLRETERAVRDLGFKGILVNTSVKGEYLDSPRAEEFWGLAEQLQVPVFLHPPGVTVGAEHMQEWRLIEMVGRPFDTVLTIARMIHGGVFDRHPSLTFVAAHVGGAITALAGRLDFGWEMREDPTFGPWGPWTAQHPPSHYIRKLFVDTMSFHPPHVACAVETVGAEHVVFGSDYPPVPLPLERSIYVVRELHLSEKDRDGILGGNASALLKWTPDAHQH